MQPTTRVAVIGEHRLARERLTALLNGQPDLRVVAAAEGPHTGLMQVRQTQPHVVLVDASLGKASSHPFVEALKREAPGASVIVLDLLPERHAVVDFVRAGATAFVSKRAGVDDLLETVRAAAVGTAVVPLPFTQALFAYIAAQRVERSAPAVPARSPLSQRERDVIALVAEGLRNKEIAQRLHLTTHTVKSHVRSILRKLSLRRRVEIVAHAPTGLRASAPPSQGLDRSICGQSVGPPGVAKSFFSPLSDVPTARLRSRSSLSGSVP